MTETKGEEAGGPESAPAELPPSETWTPEQALAAAARAPYVEVVVIGFRADGEPLVLHSRMRSEHMLWLADELRDYAKATGGPLKEG